MVRAITSLIRLALHLATSLMFTLLRLTSRVMIFLTPIVLRVLWLVFLMMLMSVVSLFVGVPTTVHRLAVRETEKEIGMSYKAKPNLYHVNRIKASVVLVIGWLVWTGVIVWIVYTLTKGVS